MIFTFKINNIALVINYRGNEEVERFFELGEKINFWKKDLEFFDLIKSQFFIKKDGIYLNKFWALEICKSGGIFKRDFVEFQILAYRLKEEYERGFIDIKIDGYEPNWKPFESRDGRTTKEMIKYYKKLYPTKSKGCTVTQKFEDGFIKICCICGNKDILLFRKI